MLEHWLLAAQLGLIAAFIVWMALARSARDQTLVRRLLEFGRDTPSTPDVTRWDPPRALVAAGRLVPLRVAGIIPQPRFDPGFPEAARPAWHLAAAGITLVFVALALLALSMSPVLALGALVLAIGAPSPIVRVLVAARTTDWRRQVDREVPAALGICVLALESGLPFDRALSTYAGTAQTPLAFELRTTIDELDVGYRRREALARLVERVRSPNLEATARAARLAEDFGTPLAASLRALVVDLRSRRRQRLQEAALRAPVTMLLPTAGLILLPIFAIILGPIAIRVISGTIF